MEKIVETKTCKHCNSNFEITDKDMEFYDKVSPIFAGKKYRIPAPMLCPECRQQRRLSFRNEFIYYKRKCDSCRKEIISIHNELSKFPVFCQKCWWNYDFETLNKGISFDFSKSFFEQYSNLQDIVSKISMLNDNGVNSENSEYCYNFSYGKNAYLVTTAWHVEDSMYCQYGGYYKNTLDSNLIWNSEVIYECTSLGNSFNCSFLQDSIDCNNCHFGIDLKGCKDCYFCYGLRNKQYHIFNKSFSKEEYEKEIKKFNFGSYKNFLDLKEKFEEYYSKTPRLATHTTNCTDCVGDRLTNCKNVQGFNIFNGENCKYYWGGADSPRNSYDIFIGGDHDLGYESIVPDLTYKACFTNYCFKSRDVFYSDNCYSSSFLFGCIGLRNKSYCILNKQYTKEQYEKLVPKIIEHMIKIGEWGEFFPSRISPFGYNETVARENFPLIKEEAVKQNFNWIDYEIPFPKTNKVIPAYKLPDNIKDTPDDILNRAIECEITKKPFKIIKQELEFYRKHNLPIPRRHPDQRHLDRIALRNPRKLYDRKCYNCGIDMKTTYSPDREEIVYCEKCYNKEVY